MNRLESSSVSLIETAAALETLETLCRPLLSDLSKYSTRPNTSACHGFVNLKQSTVANNLTGPNSVYTHAALSITSTHSTFIAEDPNSPHLHSMSLAYRVFLPVVLSEAARIPTTESCKQHQRVESTVSQNL